MSETYSEPLAELYLTVREDPEEIYCLCSRVFVSSKETSDREKCLQTRYEEDSASDCDDTVQSDNAEIYTESNKQEGDHEVFSCYYSASHTDNISTDEHDSIRENTSKASTTIEKDEREREHEHEQEFKEEPYIDSSTSIMHNKIHSSDSGADLTDYTRNECDAAFLKYWHDNQEQIIINSWITQYSAYINPEFIQQNPHLFTNGSSGNNSKTNVWSVGGDEELEENEAETDNSVIENVTTTTTTNINANVNAKITQIQQQQNGIVSSTIGVLSKIKEKEVLTGACVGVGVDYQLNQKRADVVQKNQMLIRNLSGSESMDLTSLNSEGWNPLASSSELENETERLLNSRCGSHASSSVRTVDSLTNVTRMTVSSIDLSNSSKTSDSISSVSSVQSSLSSSSSEEMEDNLDYDQQWQFLWKKNYEEQYNSEYNKFIASWHCEHPSSEFPEGSKTLCSSSSHNHKHIPNVVKKTGAKSDKRKQNKDKEKEEEGVSSTTAISGTSRLDQLVKEITLEDNTTSGDDESKSLSEEEVESYIEENNSELEQMQSMGLPLSFGGVSSSNKKQNNSNRKNKSLSNNKNFKSLQAVLSAFDVIGLEFDAGNLRIEGSVDYKMKHIRLQNKQLKMFANKRPQHLWFDDEGNAHFKSSSTTTMEETASNQNGKGEEKNQQQETQEVSDYSEQNCYSSSSEEHKLKTENEGSVVATTSKHNNLIAANNAICNKEAGESSSPSLSAAGQRKKMKRKSDSPIDCKLNAKMKNYYRKKYSLFSKFDEGIKLDEESWYSVTPEKIAKVQAQKCKCDVIVDGFCGAGGNSIQFAFTCKKVIAIDIDPIKLEMAKHNAEIYKVADKIEFICGDFFKLAPTLKADVVFLSPPWGGPNYCNREKFDLETMLLPCPYSKMLEAARSISNDIALFLPRNSNMSAAIEEARNNGRKMELVQCFLNKKLIALTVYYNDLVRKPK